jgi:periplasmic protein TonB
MKRLPSFLGEMRAFPTAACLLSVVAARLVTATTQDAEGCKDPAFLKRISGCVIAACTAKEHDKITLQVGAHETQSRDASIDSVTYSCPADLSPQQAARNLDGKLRAASYQIVFEDMQDATSAGVTARKGTQWIQLNSDVADDGTMYTVSVAETDPKKPAQVKSCTGPTAPAIEQRACVVVECNSGSSDGVKVRTGSHSETSLKGPLVETTLICEKLTPAQVFESALNTFRDENFEIVFEDRTRAADSWLTGRSGKRWIELTNSQEGDSMLYLLTALTSTEEVADAKSPTEVTLIPAPHIEVAPPRAETRPPAVETPVTHSEVIEPHPEPAKKPEPVSAPPPPEPPPPATTVASAPNVPATVKPTPTIPTPARLPIGPLIPPKLLAQARMEVPASLRKSILGDVVITVDLEIDESGQVAKAALAGKITKNAQKLESAALDAVRRSKFEPARQGDQPVPGRTTLKFQFEGEPIRTNISIH